MSGYLLAVIGTVILSAILTAILPEGRTSGLIKTIARLACVLAIISPVLQFLQTDKLSFGKVENSMTFFSESVIEAEESFIQYYSEMRIRENEEALKSELTESFTEVESVTLDWEFETETISESIMKTIKITGIFVKLNEQSNEEAIEGMWEYLTQNYCSEVLIE